MNAARSFKGYDRVSEAEEHTFRRKRFKRLTIISISSILLIIILVVVVATTVNYQKMDKKSNEPMSINQSIGRVCNVTRYRYTCYDTMLAATSDNSAKYSDPEVLLKVSLGISAKALWEVKPLPEKLAAGVNDTAVISALKVCVEVIGDSFGRVNDSISLMTPVNGEKMLTKDKIDDLRTWLSASLTDQDTCVDAFEGLSGQSKSVILSAMRNCTERTSNSLAIATEIESLLEEVHMPLHRRLLGFPSVAVDGQGGDTVINAELHPKWIRKM